MIPAWKLVRIQDNRDEYRVPETTVRYVLLRLESQHEHHEPGNGANCNNWGPAHSVRQL